MQEALFYERFEDALDTAIRACGGRKTVACEMWPDKPQREAHNLMDACLNPERRERFSPAQVLFIAKRASQAGCHAVLQFMAAECGYEVKPISKAEEVDRLTTVVEQSTKTLASALAALERIQNIRA